MNMDFQGHNKYPLLNQIFFGLPFLHQVGENQGVGGQSRPRSLGHPLQRQPGESTAGHERRGETEVLQRAQDAEVN